MIAVQGDAIERVIRKLFKHEEKNLGDPSLKILLYKSIDGLKRDTLDKNEEYVLARILNALRTS
jgi:hypothetical protein